MSESDAPTADPRVELVADCVHCGFCLPACPTYDLWGEEMDSPRGRIQLISDQLAGAALSPTVVGHLDACLGCLACVPACPSGVRYDKLIELTREQLESTVTRPWRDRALRGALFAVFPYPARLRLARAGLLLFQRVPARLRARLEQATQKRVPRLAALQRLAPPLTPMSRLAVHLPAVGTERARVAVLTGCVQSVFFADVNAATQRVLAAEGCTVLTPPRQGCCGALSAHVGRTEEARRLARALIDQLADADVDYIVVNAAGCGSMVKEYAELLADEPAYRDRAARVSARARDVNELLVELAPRAPRHPLPMSVAYHDACHLANAQGIRSQPRALLSAIPGLELRELPGRASCCGSAGVYNLLHPEPARELGERAAQRVRDCGAQLLVTANPGCLLQIAAALRRGDATDAPVAFAHPIQVLDASLRGVPATELLEPR